MKLEEARAIHKKTGQKYKRCNDPYWLYEENGILKMNGPMIPIIHPCSMDADDWIVEQLPERSHDEEDLSLLNGLLSERVTSEYFSSPGFAIHVLAGIIKRKCFEGK